jgi:outer membrane protein assembly factor BamB
LSKQELAGSPYQKDLDDADLNGDGILEEREWEKYRERRTLVNSVMAVRLGGAGDMTDKSILWRFYKSLPNVPSPLLYRNVLYLMKEGGILTALDPATGSVLKQGRLKGALDFYYSSPVGADGKIFTSSEDGHVSVIKAGVDWEVLAVNDMNEPVYATPAPVDQQLFLRTRNTLYCFGNTPKKKAEHTDTGARD